MCVSPLTSIVIDQRQKFTPKGLKVEFVGEAQTDESCIKAVLQGKIQLVYISPESLLNNRSFRNMLLSPTYKAKLCALVVDEAHCVRTWGDKFRVAFAKIGNIRSLLPTGVNVLALTATATKETYKIVCERLSTPEPALIAVSPCKSNIFYIVLPEIPVEELSKQICAGTIKERCCYPKTIVFTRDYGMCAQIFFAIRSKLGSDITDPPVCPLQTKFLVVDMFTRVCTEIKKEKLVSVFSSTSSKLRDIIATTAFGMGIDVPDIRAIIHWGLPSNEEEYVQETGRGGRYAENTSECRRQLLFKGFF